MLADSGILNDVGNFAFSPAGQPMCVYGDPAYPLRIHLQAPYSQGRLTQQMEDYNKRVRGSSLIFLLNFFRRRFHRSRTAFLTFSWNFGEWILFR